MAGSREGAEDSVPAILLVNINQKNARRALLQPGEETILTKQALSREMLTCPGVVRHMAYAE